ncbi:MAG: DUF975 family protein [Carnobacterium sp.]|uniref:DUF975 family protein n=1 Tax=Carnobacterium antarcticum TaxID=2126436 RepID=A0ABW4NPJ9_9LACT|nr:DUF975 family protein [Carnobacterium sp. CP1]ALV21287.1 Integral membrane protein [Carnobacterium sp. CP1]
MKIKEIKQTARQRLKGNWKVAILNLLVISVLSGVISQVIFGVMGLASFSTLTNLFDNAGSYDPYTASKITISSGILASLIGMFVGILTSVLSVGYDWSILDMVDGAKLTVEALFQTFSRKRIWKVLGLTLVTSILVMLWSLLLVIPGIIKSYSYSQALNILKDEPEITIMDALDKSRKMMKGKKWKLFRLQLSILLWLLVPLFVFIIFLLGSLQTLENSSMNGGGVMVAFIIVFILLMIYTIFISFYIQPYQITAKQVFYRELSDGTTPFQAEQKYDEEYEGTQLEDVELK